MNLQIAERVRPMTPSSTSALAARTTELRAAGHDIIGMGTGELDFDTPQHIKQAAKDAIDQGFTRYTAVDGIAELKQAIINKFSRENQLEYGMKQVMVSCGCKQTLYNLAQAVLNEGGVDLTRFEKKTLIRLLTDNDYTLEGREIPMQLILFDNSTEQ